MSETPEALEAPNWLQELERKREVRLKARLGHEAGAGAPCIQCEDKCPGLDLHFWRKICKNCKCSKEDHDVHDDDIYGWAQFQLLGAKPTRERKKIVLPGKKDAVELEWAPKGNTETIDNYLKTLSPDSLPVKGSQAAQDRKQLLQKQIPIHDIDPGLCHELTDSELAKMQDYIKHTKGSAGVGQIVQFGVNYGQLHHLDEAKSKVMSERYPKGISSIENVKLLSGELHKQLEKLGVKDQKELDAFFDTIPNPANMTAHGEMLGYVGPNQPPRHTGMIINDHAERNQMTSDTKPILNPLYSQNMPYNKLGYVPLSHPNLEINENRTNPAVNFARNHILNYVEPTNPNVEQQALANEINQNPAGYLNQDLNSNVRGGLKGLKPSEKRVKEDDLKPDNIKIGAIRDINYDFNPEVKQALQTQNVFDDQFENNVPELPPSPKTCRKCLKDFANGEFAIFVEKSNGYYHSSCFKCGGCNQNLADLLYFYDKENEDIYCLRDFAKIRGIPRCKACDELIFVKEYCLAENNTFHLKHFCCFECDKPLAGQNYVLDESNQPLCLPCYEKVKASKCLGCGKVIGPEESGVRLTEDTHFHAETCFQCFVCRKSLHGAKLLFRNKKLYCSHDCFKNDN